MATLASKGTVTVTLSPGETLNVEKGGQGVAVLKGGQFIGQSFELGTAVRKIGPFGFDMPVVLNSQSGAITYSVDSYIPEDESAPRDKQDFLEILELYASDASEGGYIMLRPGLDLEFTSPITINTAKTGLHLNGSVLRFPVAGQKAINLTYSPQDTAAGNRYRQYMYEIGHGRIVGPGKIPPVQALAFTLTGLLEMV